MSVMRQNHACDLQITVVKPTSVLVVGFNILEAIDNGGLTCQRQDRSAGLNSGHVNVQLTLSDRKKMLIRKFNGLHFNQVYHRKRVNPR